MKKDGAEERTTFDRVMYVLFLLFAASMIVAGIYCQMNGISMTNKGVVVPPVTYTIAGIGLACLVGYFGFFNNRKNKK